MGRATGAYNVAQDMAVLQQRWPTAGAIALLCREGAIALAQAWMDWSEQMNGFYVEQAFTARLISLTTAQEATADVPPPDEQPSPGLPEWLERIMEEQEEEKQRLLEREEDLLSERRKIAANLPRRMPGRGMADTAMT